MPLGYFNQERLQSARTRFYRSRDTELNEEFSNYSSKERRKVMASRRNISQSLFFPVLGGRTFGLCQVKR